MPERPDAMETTRLALELLRRIPRSRKITATELRQQLSDVGLQRDLRTVQRLLDTLSQHFDIDRDTRSKPYGYSWLPQSQGFTVPNLTPRESIVLSLAEDHLKNILPARLLRSMEGFFTQARRNLGPDSNATLEREWPNKVRVVATSQPLLPPKIANGVFETVTEALYNNRWLAIEYHNAEGKRGTYDVMPLGLAQQGARLYLVCRYRGYDNERCLALHRIQTAEMSGLKFDRPKDFNLKQFDDDGRFGFGQGNSIRLSFRITRAAGLHLLESALSTDQKAVEIDNQFIDITATVIESDMLERWLRGFGDAVTNINREATPTPPEPMEPQ